ncbi:MAG: hypothetical protein RJS97_00630 [Parvibaculaceae bacterium]
MERPDLALVRILSTCAPMDKGLNQSKPAAAIEGGGDEAMG